MVLIDFVWYVLIIYIAFKIGGRRADREWYENGDGVKNPKLEKRWYDLN